METNEEPSNDHNDSTVISLTELVGEPRIPRVQYVIMYLVVIVFAIVVLPLPWNTFAILGGLVLLMLSAWPRVNTLMDALSHLDTQAETGAINVEVVIAHQGWLQFSKTTPGSLVIRSGVIELISPNGNEWWRASQVTIAKAPPTWSQGGIKLLTPSGRRVISLVPDQDPAEQFRARVDARGHGAIDKALALNSGPHQ